jgi:hypothetical protein
MCVFLEKTTQYVSINIDHRPCMHGKWEHVPKQFAEHVCLNKSTNQALITWVELVRVH